MLFTISEAFRLFKDQYPEVDIGRSKFAELRPSEIKPYRDIPHNVCVCRYHENFENLRVVVSQYLPGFGTSSTDFINSIVCDPNNINCMSYDCSLCKNKFMTLLDDSQNDEKCSVTVQYRQWIMVDKRYEYVLLEEALNDAIEKIKEQFPFLLTHSFNQNQSQKCFKMAKEISSATNVVIQVDFAENYSCNYQNEIQSAHWSNPQIALFTAVIWCGKETCESYAVVSENITHDRYCVDIFLRAVLNTHISKNSSFKHLHVFSDGAASQFKQKYNFANITLLKQDFRLESLKWTFFASSHGKGAVDGIGAIVKHHVWNKVRSLKTVVRSADAFRDCCKSLSTIVIAIPLSTIEKKKKNLDKNWEGIITVKGTQKIHQVVALSPYVIGYKYHALDLEERIKTENLLKKGKK